MKKKYVYIKYLIKKTFHTVGIFFSSPPLKENALKRFTLTKGIMAEMSTSDYFEKVLEFCYNKQVNLLVGLGGREIK